MEISKKKIFAFLKSMKLGLILLGLLCLVSIIGSIVPQGRQPEFYTNNYTPLISQLIISFKAYDIYHSIGFIMLFVGLAVNLFLCSTIRFKSVIKNITKKPMAPNTQNLKNPILTENFYDSNGIREIFTDQGFKNIDYTKIKDSEEIYFSTKGKIGYLGSWLIHVGILLIIVFYSYGQYTFFDTAVYGVPGATQNVDGTNLKMKIDKFDIKYRDDGSVEQYITNGTLLDENGNSLISDEIFVNKPMRYKGYTFYQNSTGWAVDANVFKGNESLGSKVLYDGTAYINNQEYIAIQLHQFYPDFISTETGFSSKSNDLNNPKILYSLFYGGQRVVMNVASPEEEINWEDYNFKFTSPQRYTYLSINKMNGKIGAMFGSTVLMLGLFLAFYMKPKQLIIQRKNDEFFIFGDYNPSLNSKLKENHPN